MTKNAENTGTTHRRRLQSHFPSLPFLFPFLHLFRLLLFFFMKVQVDIHPVHLTQSIVHLHVRRAIPAIRLVVSAGVGGIIVSLPRRDGVIGSEEDNAHFDILRLDVVVVDGVDGVSGGVHSEKGVRRLVFVPGVLGGVSGGMPTDGVLVDIEDESLDVDEIAVSVVDVFE